jgi:hypothetical protein
VGHITGLHRKPEQSALTAEPLAGMPCQYTFHQGLPCGLQSRFHRFSGAVAGWGVRPSALTAPLIDRRFEEIFMRGVVMHGPGDVRVEERERPRIVEPTDAIIRVLRLRIRPLALPRHRGDERPDSDGS